MKLENEHVLSVQTSPRKSYNPFDSDDEDSSAYAKGNINGYDIKSFETTPESLTFHLDTSNLSWEEAILGHSQILSNSIAADASREVLYRKDNELFTDKVVTECELPPELMFSYKDNGFHSVKDIGIDEGVPTLDKVWIESQDNYESTKLPAIQVLGNDVNSDLSFMDSLKKKSDEEVKKERSAQSNETEDSGKESGLVHEVLERPYSADLLKADEFKHGLSKKEEETNCGWKSTEGSVKSDDLVSGTKDHQSSQKDDLNGPKVETAGDEVSVKEHCNDSLPLEHTVEFPAKPLIMHDKVATTESDEVHHAEMYPAKPLMMHEVETTLKSDEAHQEEVIPAKPSIKHEVEATVESSPSTEIQNDKPTAFQSGELPASQELPGSSVTDSLPYNSTVETGSIVLDFNADTSSLDKENEEVLQKTETAATIEKPPGVQSMSRDGVGSLPGNNSILDCGTDKRVHGETSFSAAMPPPSSITYMGPVAYSGNISLRSESSAGSTRSFAFPVLQAEWNSSPVRMAKADQEHLRKQRGWVHSLVCCKF